MWSRKYTTWKREEEGRFELSGQVEGHFIRDSPKVAAGSNGWLLASFHRSMGILLAMRSSNAEPMLYPQGRDGRNRSFRHLLTTRCCYQATATTLFASLPFLRSLCKFSLRCNFPLVGRTSPLCAVCLVSKIPVARMIWTLSDDSNGVCLTSRICSSLMIIIIYWWKWTREIRVKWIVLKS